MGRACDPGLPTDYSHSTRLVQTVSIAQVRDLALLFRNLFKNVQRKNCAEKRPPTHVTRRQR